MSEASKVRHALYDAQDLVEKAIAAVDEALYQVKTYPTCFVPELAPRLWRQRDGLERRAVELSATAKYDWSADD